MASFAVIGGGTGSYNVLRGLKRHTSQLTAIVTMFDSGGSSGKLRDEFGILPPGDVRRCLLALAPETADTILLRQLLDYRFERGTGLQGHNFGNLFLTALSAITGGDLQAIEAAARILGISGKVLPVSLDSATLCAELETGQVVRGEADIDVPKHNASLRITRVFLDPGAVALPDALAAIRHADVVVIGPGDLFTSVIPNLLVEGVVDALRRSPARKIFVCNLMTKRGETDGFKASDFVRTLQAYLGENVLDAIVCSTQSANTSLLQRYAAEGARPVEIDAEAVSELGVRVHVQNLITEPTLIRHDPDKLAHALLEAAK